MKSAVSILAIVGVVCGCLHGIERASAQGARQRHLIEALLGAQVSIVYRLDDTSGTTITAGASDDPLRLEIPAEVRAILDLGPDSIPLLVGALDDERLTEARVDTGPGNAEIAVPLGYLCLDILLHATTRESAPHWTDCTDVGSARCVKGGYYFRPDALRRPEGRAQMREVKRRWQQAMWGKRLEFRRPILPHRS